MRQSKLRRLLHVGFAVAVTTILLGATAGLSAAAPGVHGHAGQGNPNANGQSDSARPGWGYGDPNHTHYGPPGQGCTESSPCSGQVSAAPNQPSGAATHFAVSAPASVSAGSAFTFTVTALDQNNNTATSYNGTIHFSSSDGAASLPGNSALTNGTATFSATLSTVGAQTITATDTLNSSITGTSGDIAVSVSGAATHFSVSAPSSVSAGSAFTFTVTALDQNNNTATSYSGTVHFTSSDPEATLPANATLTNGTGSFSATLATVGNQTITATDTVTASLTGTSGSIAVSASGAATHFVVSAPPTADAGSPFSFTVTALDQYNNPVTSYGGTVHFTSTDSSATLPADTKLTNGTGSFTATLNRRGNQTITATDTVDSSVRGTSGNIAVSVSETVTHFAVSAPASVNAGSPFSFTVTALDRKNRTVTSYNGTVQFSTTDKSESVKLPDKATLTNGTGTFSATLATQGAQTITATDTLDSSLTGTSGTTTVNAGQ